MLAIGGRLKNTVTLSWGQRAIVSPYVGDSDTPRSIEVLEQVANDLQALYGVRAKRIACDPNKRYLTHQWAERQSLTIEPIWHHRAHASALAGEYSLPGRWLVFTWDNVGLGDDGSLWGGEALLGTPGDWRRVASFRRFRLPGGENAGLEPWRSAAALHWECERSWTDCPDHGDEVRNSWERGVDCPRTSAAGRLFDAAAALITGQLHVSFEAQGPMLLESLCRRRREPVYTGVRRNSDGIWRSDWQPLLERMADDSLDRASRAEIFHSSMALALLQQARRVRDEYRIDQIGLCGGVFQNRVLTEQVIELLERNDFRVYLPAALPTNESALSFGQAVECAARSEAA